MSLSLSVIGIYINLSVLHIPFFLRYIYLASQICGCPVKLLRLSVSPELTHPRVQWASWITELHPFPHLRHTYQSISAQLKIVFIVKKHEVIGLFQ